MTDPAPHNPDRTDPRLFYCPNWTLEHVAYKRTIPGPNVGGGIWPEDEVPAEQDWMQTTYSYRSSFDGPDWRSAHLSTDYGSEAIMADAFPDPRRGIDQTHREGYNILHLDGHVDWHNDLTFIVRDFNGGATYYAGFSGYTLMEEVWSTIFSR